MPVPTSGCQDRVCTNNVCGFSNKLVGTILNASDKDGNCQHTECAANGVEQTVDDDNDVPTNTNECVTPSCAGGNPVTTNKTSGTMCTQNMGMECDGNGQCVGCINASECGTDDLCFTRTCDMGVCGVAFKLAGIMTTDQHSGNCKLNVCDGAGNAVDMTDSGDLPTDTNQCVTPTCTGNDPSTPPKAVGTACLQNEGVRCDATQSCVPTFMSVRIGDGSAALSSAATPVFVDERAETDGFVFRTITLQSGNMTGVSPKSLTLSGLADSDGHLALSGDGHYVTLAGYNAAAGTAGVASTSTSVAPVVPRIAASINLAGTVNTTTTFGTAFNTDNVRSAVSNDGGQFWAGGNCSGSSCIRGVLYATNPATTSTLIESASGSTRVCIIAFGALYCDASNGSRGIFTVGTGLPTAAAGTLAITNTVDTNAQYYGLAILDLTGGPNSTPDGVPDTMYVADERAPVAGGGMTGGGIQKFTLSGNTAMIRRDVHRRPHHGRRPRPRGARQQRRRGPRSPRPHRRPTSPATNPNSNAILKYLDTGVAPASVTPTTLQAATAGANKVYRGVAVSPK